MMTQEQFDNVLTQLNEYVTRLDSSKRDEEEYVQSIIEYFQDNMDTIVDDDIELKDIFEELREQQEYMDGGYREDMYPDVDEDDEEYSHTYDPYDNDAYRLHSKVLNELQNYLGIGE